MIISIPEKVTLWLRTMLMRCGRLVAFREVTLVWITLLPVRRSFAHNPRESRFLAPLCEWPVAAECGTIDSIFEIKALPIWTSAV
jgi:hypothetical protein